MWCFSEPFSTQENFDRKRLCDSQIRRNKLWSRVDKISYTIKMQRCSKMHCPFFCQSVLQMLEIVQYRLQEVPLTPEGGSKLKDSQVIPVRCETILDCQHQSKISGSNLGRNTFLTWNNIQNLVRLKSVSVNLISKGSSWLGHFDSYKNELIFSEI